MITTTLNNIILFSCATIILTIALVFVISFVETLIQKHKRNKGVEELMRILTEGVKQAVKDPKVIKASDLEKMFKEKEKETKEVIEDTNEIINDLEEKGIIKPKTTKKVEKEKNSIINILNLWEKFCRFKCLVGLRLKILVDRVMRGKGK